MNLSVLLDKSAACIFRDVQIAADVAERRL